MKNGTQRPIKIQIQQKSCDFFLISQVRAGQNEAGMLAQFLPGMAVFFSKLCPYRCICLFQQQQNVRKGFHPDIPCLGLDGGMMGFDIGIDHFRMLRKMEGFFGDLLSGADGNAAGAVIVVVEGAI